jgi:hypothetical protein
MGGLKMQLQIDAWLERRDPLIRVIDADSGREFLHLGPKQIHELMESGDICPSDLGSDFSSYVALIALVEERAA